MRPFSFLSVAIDGWRFASQAFAAEKRSKLRWQKIRGAASALMSPRFAAKWFKILNSPDFLFIRLHRQRLYFKPFRVYMSIKWTKEQRLKVITDTYRFITSRGNAFFRVITHPRGIEIARFKLNDTAEAKLVISYDEKHRKEGELVMFFVCNELGGMIATGSFSFEEKKDGNWICWIGSIQGHKINSENSSKVAQNLMHGQRPKAFIVFAIQEFARQMGCTAIYGAGDSIQAYRKQHTIHLPWVHSIGFDYNAVWEECGGKAGKDGWYELPLTFEKKTGE